MTELETKLADLLLNIEGTILGYWTDIPESECERLRVEIRDVLLECNGTRYR